MDELFEIVDFASVGSNDLLQFLTACDRGNMKLSGRFDSLTKANMSALKSIVDAGAKAGKTVTLCGEMGGRPIEALALLGIGYRSLSMNPSSIGPVKAAVLETNLETLRAEVEAFMSEMNGETLRERLTRFAITNDIPL